MVKRLDRYVAGYFLSSYAVAFFFFIGLFIILDLVGRVDDILDTAREHEISKSTLAGVALQYYLYYIPVIFLQVSPFLTLISSIVTVARLRRANELIPIIMSGRSVFRLLLPVFVVALLLTGTMILIQQRLAPQVADHRAATLAFLKGGEEELIIHPRPFVDAEGRTWSFQGYHLKNRKIQVGNVFWREDDRNFHLEGRDMSYDYALKGWRIGDQGKLWDLVDKHLSPSEPRDFIEGGPTPEQVTSARKSVYELSLSQIADLYNLTGKVKWKVLLHYHITFPVSNMLLILLGVPFVLRLDNRSFYVGVAVALIVCTIYFVVDFAVRHLGAKGVLDPVWAAWLPVIVFGSAGIVMFDSVQT